MCVCIRQTSVVLGLGLFVVVVFYVRRPHCKLDLYICTTFINDICTFSLTV